MNLNPTPEQTIKYQEERLNYLDELSYSTVKSACQLGWSILNKFEYNWTDDTVPLPEPLAQIRDAIEAVKSKGLDIHQWTSLHANSIAENEPPHLREGYFNAAILAHLERLILQQALSTLLIGYQTQ